MTGLMPMSRQAMSQRFGPNSSRFLLHCLDQLLQRKIAEHRELTLTSQHFRRICITDSTIISMHKSNAEAFPNNGNGKVSTAGVKVDFTFDYLSGEPIDMSLQSARDPDQKLAENVFLHLEPGDLVMRDMGYFKLSHFAEIEACGAFWISRLPASVTGAFSDGVSLDERLRKTKRNTLDCHVTLGSRKGGPRVRLVAQRLPKHIVAANRRQRRKMAKKRRATASKQGLRRDEWQIIVCNVGDDKLSAQQLRDLYRMRWSIEIEFRAFKQSCSYSKAYSRRSNYFHYEAIMLAGLLISLMSMNFAKSALRQGIERRELSREKLYDFVLLAIQISTSIGDVLQTFRRADQRHLRMDRRKRESLHSSTARALT